MELQMCTNRRQHELCPTAHANPELQRKEMRSQGLSLRGQAESPKQAQDDAADGDGPHVALVVLWQGNTARGVEQRPRHLRDVVGEDAVADSGQAGREGVVAAAVKPLA